MPLVIGTSRCPLCRSAQLQCGRLVRRAATCGRPPVQIVNSFMQPRRKPATLTARSRNLEFTTTSATDELSLPVPSRPPSADATLARFRQDIVPQLDAAYNFARFLSRNG